MIAELEMKNVAHTYGMTVRTADDGDVELTCTSTMAQNALALLHKQAQKRWPRDAYVMLDLWEEYGEPDFRKHPDNWKVIRSHFDVPAGPNPIPIPRRKKAEDRSMEIFSKEELDRCR